MIGRSPSDLHTIFLSGRKDVTIRLLWDCDNFLCTEFRLQSDWRSFIVFFCIRCTLVFSHLLMMMLMPISNGHQYWQPLKTSPQKIRFSDFVLVTIIVFFCIRCTTHSPVFSHSARWWCWCPFIMVTNIDYSGTPLFVKISEYVHVSACKFLW